MGFLDKIKQQASGLANQAQDLGKIGQDRLEDVQNKGKVNSLLKDLGAAVYAERSGNSPTASAGMAKAMEELQKFEAQGTPIPAPKSPSEMSSAPPPKPPKTASTTETITISSPTTPTPSSGPEVITSQDLS